MCSAVRMTVAQAAVYILLSAAFSGSGGSTPLLSLTPCFPPPPPLSLYPLFGSLSMSALSVTKGVKQIKDFTASCLTVAHSRHASGTYITTVGYERANKMAEPTALIGVIGVAVQLLEIAGKLYGAYSNWKGVPEEARKFILELQTLRIVLAELHRNCISNPEFAKAFHRRPSSLLSQLDPLHNTETRC